MANFRGYFRGFDRPQSNNPNGDLYCVHIGDFSANTYTELLMADTPFVVQYDTSKTPFDPVRTSTATIRVLNSTYSIDLFPTTAQEMPVVLYNETVARIEWCGFITPKIYDGSYVDCLDTIDIEAADCISSLQYIDYTPCNSSGKTIAPLNKILGNICNGAGILERYYWTNGKMFGGADPMLPEFLYLSEQNFYSSDTDEPWKMDVVLEEICRYFGFTCMQFGNAMYLIDFLAYKEDRQLVTRYYTKSNDYDFISGNVVYLAGGNCVVNAEDFRGSNGTISLEPIYNKCTVKANMYACERILPSMFADENLVNRIDSGHFYTTIELTVPNPDTASYPYGGFINQGYKAEDAPDSKYSYFMRVYDSTKGWTSVYAGSTDTYKPTTQAGLTLYPGGTIVDLGVVRNEYYEYGQLQIASKLDYTRYLMINQQNIGYLTSGMEYLVYNYKGKVNLCPFDPKDAYLVIQGSARNTKYTDRCYINPDWSKNGLKLATLGSGSLTWTDTKLCMLIKIGNKYWTGRQWSDTKTIFTIPMQKTDDNLGYSNTERQILNNVSYAIEVGEDGYLIPLSGVSYSLTDEIQIQVHMPTVQYIYGNQKIFNGFVWIKDFDIKLVQKGQTTENKEGDMVYENVINEDAVSDLSDITCKLTSYTSGVAPSYSTVMYLNLDTIPGTIMPLSGFVDNSSTEARTGEENIIEKYVQEYQHQTRKITYTLDNQLSGLRPWSRFYRYDPDEPEQMYVILGEEIDYQKGTNTITAVELK